MGELVAAIDRADFVVCHNAKFELGWLRRCGVDLRKIISYDTMIGEYVLGGNTYMMRQLSLSASLERYGFAPKEDTIASMFKAGIATEEMPESWLLKYCIRDVEACCELFLKQRELLRAKGLEAVNYQRNLVTPALADIEFAGLQLDTEKVNELTKAMEEEYAKATSALQDFCEGASPASSKQLREFVFGVLKFAIPRDHKGNPMVTKGGDPSIAAPVLERLRPATARQSDFLRLHREWAAMHSDVTKYLRKFGECCSEADGLLRGSFNQCNTRTHRLSSSGLEYKANLQNLNRRFKPLFSARNAGWLMGEADGAQLEFRVATHLGKDRVALADIVSGADIHAYTASIIGCSRQDAKPHTFKPLYGGVSGTAAERAYYTAFAEKYNQIATTQRGWTLTVAEDKELTTEWGMKYYWPDAKLKESGYVTYTTSIFNYPVQAFATAEIIPIAIVCAWHRMRDLNSFLINTVHDSIIAEVHPEEVDEWHAIAKQCLIHDTYKLINSLYGVKLTVPLGAGVTLGTHWANKEAKAGEVVYTAPDDLWIDAAKEAGML
jgi:DNA polymerase I-like protein with 3'-5' exonuclease and polymerase domains